MIAEFFLSAKVKTFLGILIVYCIVIEADHTLHKVETVKEIPRIEADTIQVKKDSLKLNLDRTIEKLERQSRTLQKICKKT